MDIKTTLKFIEDYRKLEILWDVKHKFYMDKVRRNDAYSNLGTKYKMQVKTVKTKIKCLRSYFSKEHAKVLSKKSGSGADEVYESSWFAYTPLMFIADSLTPRNTRDSLNVEEDDNETQMDILSDLESEENLSIQSSSTVVKPNASSRSRPTPPQNKRNISNRDEEDKKREDEAYSLLKTATQSLKQKDSLTVFGESVALQLRELNRRNQLVAQKDIQVYLTDLKLNEMDEDIDI